MGDVEGDAPHVQGAQGDTCTPDTLGQAGKAQAGPRLHPCLRCEPRFRPPRVPQFPHPSTDAVFWRRGCWRNPSPRPPGSGALF